MNICVVGAGYVGIPTAACFAEYGNSVVCYDIDLEKIKMLNNGHIPIYEPDLEQLVMVNIEQGRLQFSTNLEESITRSQIIMICVGTPPCENGEPNLTDIWESAHQISKYISNDTIVVLKSTVPVGTTHRFFEILDNNKFNKLNKINIAFCPEFLKQGSAIIDTMTPDRLIIGSDYENVKQTLNNLYTSFNRNHSRTIHMSIKDAEMTKYVANAMLATRISFMNEISLLCDAVGADIEQVRLGIGSDPRIGYSFLYAGLGYGGSCFPKDISALIALGHKNNINCSVLEAVKSRNIEQKKYILKKITSVFGKNLSGKKIACWGASFKPGTDDLREAPSLEIINSLIDNGAIVYVYDPIASSKMNKWFSQELIDTKKLIIANDMYNCLKYTDALILITEWKPFRNPDFNVLKEYLFGKYIFDGRNQLDPSMVESYGISYFGVGRGRS